ncbi:DNA repair protein RAD51 [Cymbomonas tetramitiformis]|uniref:DNA repair protein RAD51 n=1 Tax=Cymbomonas tetramitiformis TaxID=36881 RepID=A0AAE0FJA9_9CHLO|nr:DNA repair protein RAD51 [Cymbomonas tetramitiformis]
MASRKLIRMDLDTEVLHKLAMRNIHTAKDLLSRTELELVECADLSFECIRALLRQVSVRICPSSADLLQVMQRRRQLTTFLPTHLAALDDVLRGGIPTQGITEMVGPAGIGKTQWCQMLAVTAAMPRRLNGLEGGVVYIDTESRFSTNRLLQIAACKYGQSEAADRERIAESVMVLSPKTTAELLERLKSMETVIIERRVKLILLDSVAALPRAEYGSGKEAIVQRQEALGQLASTLKALAEAFGIPVVVTNQVTTTGWKQQRGQGDTAEFAFQQSEREAEARAASLANDLDEESAMVSAAAMSESHLTAALGTKWAHCVNTRLVLEDSGLGARTVKVVKSPAARMAALQYAITNKGIELVAVDSLGQRGYGSGDAVTMPIANSRNLTSFTAQP